MTSLILNRDGLLVARDGERLVIEEGPKQVGSFRAVDVDSVLLCGRIGLTRPAIDMLLSRRVDTHFLSRSGKYRGSLVAPADGRSHCFEQFAALGDRELRFVLARTSVRAALRNQSVILRRWAMRRPELQLSGPRHRHTEVRRALESASMEGGVAGLRGMEGAATRAFYDGLRAALPEGWQFPARRRQPPTDPINVILSLLGSVLCGTTRGIVGTTGLDATHGLLHGKSRGSPALALDLEDIYRPMCVVATTMTAISKQVVRLSDFTFEARRCRLDRRAMQRILKLYSSTLARVVSDRAGTRRTYLEHLHADTESLARACVHRDASSWEPLEIR